MIQTLISKMVQIMTSTNIKIKLNQPMAGYESGREVTIQTDRSGVPLEQFWRRRLRDAETDNCVEVVKAKAPKKPKQEHE